MTNNNEQAGCLKEITYNFKLNIEIFNNGTKKPEKVFILKEQIPLIPRDLKEIMATKWATLEEMDTLDLNSDARTYKRQIKSE